MRSWTLSPLAGAALVMLLAQPAAAGPERFRGTTWTWSGVDTDSGALVAVTLTIDDDLVQTWVQELRLSDGSRVTTEIPLGLYIDVFRLESPGVTGGCAFQPSSKAFRCSEWSARVGEVVVRQEAFALTEEA